ncbi:MAG TPA: hybrid sensor histidine kinase/response regulator [Thermoanaerobaculia bacterium]|nr:hybrid sensor histidine kinase/response regulator [Thermoanaerobaculia bacterium]HQN06788.1 hybrid sensor histidine kinase/response regulator [Thermoanaerobaculia bacterium]HQP84964.1 hybrid sensor histidine kinase/response regulator [Thermoanaerobaculia bacterium]
MSGTLKILVVDDEPGIRLAVSRVLEGHRTTLPDESTETSFEVAQAGTGEEALAACTAGAPDILLLDYKLPGLSGLDVLERLGPATAETIVVMITAYATIETAVTATRRGAFDFLAKPFTPAELRTTVSRAATHLALQRRAKRLAEEKRQARYQLLSVLFHELKSPLAAVGGYLDVLREGFLPPGSAQYDEVLERSRARLEGMRRLVVDLLDLTRLESGQRKREPVELDARDIVLRAVETAQPAAAARRIEIFVDAPEAAPLVADPGELEIVLNNLLSNAVKYNREGGRVDVRLARDAGGVRLVVADTGIGMTAQEVGRLFGEFVRIRNEKTRDIPGSGLGLSIMKKVVELAGGEVSVESEPGKGTTFTVRLPSGALPPVLTAPHVD